MILDELTFPLVDNSFLKLSLLLLSDKSNVIEVVHMSINPVWQVASIRLVVPEYVSILGCSVDIASTEANLGFYLQVLLDGFLDRLEVGLSRNAETRDLTNMILLLDNVVLVVQPLEPKRLFLRHYRESGRRQLFFFSFHTPYTDGHV